VNPRARFALLGVGLAVLVVAGGVWSGRDVVRGAEADATVTVVGALGGRVASLADHSILVVPAGHPPFRVVVTPSCSALASVLALLVLVAVAAPGGRGRRLGAFGVAAAVVVVGNVVRIGASVGIGLWTGRASLVLFHDVVGSVFGVAYTVLGYLLVVWVLLPARPRGAALGGIERQTEVVSDELVGC